MKGRLLLDVVVRQGTAVLELLAGKDQALLVWGDSLLVLDLGLDVLDRVRRLDFESDGLAGKRLDEDLHTTSQTEHKVKRRLLLDVVVAQGTAVLELLAGKDQALLVWGDSLLVLNLSLDVLDRVGRLDFESDGLAGKRLDEDLHTTSQTEHKVKRRLLLDVVVTQGTAVLELLAGKDQALLVWGDSLLVLNLGLDVLDRVRRLDFESDGLAGKCLHENLHTATQTEHKVKGRLLLDVVVAQGTTILELLAGKDQALLVWGDSLLVLDLGLDVLDRVRRLDFESDGLAGKCLDEDLHTTSQTEHKVKRRLLLDVVVAQGTAVLELLASKDQALLVWGNSLLVLDLGLDVLDRVRRLDFESDGLAGKCLHEDLHTATQTEHKVKGRLLLDVVVAQGTTILELLAGEDQALLVWGDSLLVLDLGLDVLDRVRRLDFESDGLAGKCLHEDLHTTSQTEHKVKRRLLLDVVVAQGTTILELLAGKDQALLVWGNSLLVLNLSLDVLDRVGRLDFESDGLAGKRLDEDLHTTSQTEHKVKRRLLLDVVVAQGTAVLELLAGKDQALLVWGDSLLVLDLGLDVLDRVGRLDFESDGLAGKRLDEDLHTTSQTEHKVKRRLLLDVVVAQGTAVLELLAGKDQALLVWGDSLLVLDLGLDVLDRVGRLDFESDGLAGKCLHEDLHIESTI